MSLGLFSIPILPRHPRRLKQVVNVRPCLSDSLLAGFILGWLRTLKEFLDSLVSLLLQPPFKFHIQPVRPSLQFIEHRTRPLKLSQSDHAPDLPANL